MLTRILPYDLAIPMNKLIAPLRNTDQPIYSYLWKAWLIDLAGTILIGVPVVTICVFADYGPPPDDRTAPMHVIGLLLIAPWLETLIMWRVLRLLK